MLFTCAPQLLSSVTLSPYEVDNDVRAAKARNRAAILDKKDEQKKVSNAGDLDWYQDGRDSTMLSMEPNRL